MAAGTLAGFMQGRFHAWARPRAVESLPVTLDRRRIYVLPTRFGLFMTALLLGMVLGALNYNNNPALLLCLLLTGTALSSLLWSHLQLSGLRIVGVDAEPVPAGQPLQLRLHVRAEPGRPRSGIQVDHATHGSGYLQVVEGAGTVQMPLPTARRGWMPLPRLRLSTVRPLGLARAWSYVRPDGAVLVYPAPEPEAPPLPAGEGDMPNSRRHAAGEDLHQLREYRRGDARRAIAWKPSARHGSLLVRDFEISTGAELLLDWAQLSALPYEHRIRRLARWVDMAERSGRRYQLRLPGGTLGPDSGTQHRHACLRALAVMPDA